MDARQSRYAEKPLVKTKIIATIGPACDSPVSLREMAEAGVDVFRLNFAHSEHDWMQTVLSSIRKVGAELGREIAVLGDLAGPKIRLGELPGDEVVCGQGERFEFVRTADSADRQKLTSNYPQLIDDLNVGDRMLLADGMVALRVIEKPPATAGAICEVERPGTLRSRQGINLPGVKLSTPALTEKDRDDLAWAVEHGLDFIGLSFVRAASDIGQLRAGIDEHGPEVAPSIVAKIEKAEAVSNLESILDEADAVMVARGDLGVEVEIAQVPALQKRIIRLCNERRVAVITATQMLESMQKREFPTRAEASDVANAVLDGSDAVMLSAETAVGKYPLGAVATMSRIVHEAERLVPGNEKTDITIPARGKAKVVTEAVTAGARTAAEHLDADLIVVATHSGRTAIAVSNQRSPVPILALTDQPDTARRMCLYWGVTPVLTDVVHESPQRLIEYVVGWGKRQNVLVSGSRLVMVGSTNWSAEGHDLLLVHVLP